MKKSIIALIVLIIIGAIAYSFMGKKVADAPENLDVDSSSSQGETNNEVDKEVRGAVVSVNTDGVAVDGPALVTVRETSGSTAVIAVPSMGINLCVAKANIADVYKLKAGDQVEVRGQVGAEGVIIPCESGDHYLRVVSQ